MLLNELRTLIHDARRQTAQAVNAALTITYEQKTPITLHDLPLMHAHEERNFVSYVRARNT